MNGMAVGIASVLLLTAIGITAGGQSRLETDHDRQSSHMRVLEGPTDEPSCGGGAWLKVWSLGKEVRKMEWSTESSQRFISREFYFSRGKVQLVIETTHGKLDDSGNELREPRLEHKRRYWLHDRSAGPAGVLIRRELRQHASSLIQYYSAHKREFVKTTH